MADINEGVGYGLGDLASDVGGFIGGLWSDITGKTQSDAALEAARIQSAAANQAAQLQAQATEQQRQDLMPFTQFGLSAIPMQQQAMQQQQQLFSDPMSIMQNPMFAAIMEQNQRGVLQNAAVRGRLGTGGTQQHLLDTSLRTGFDILNQERNAALANTRSILGNIALGQNAAAGQATALGQGTQIQGNLLTNAAAAQAAGQVGSANAQAAGTGNLLNLGATIFGVPTIGG